MRAWSTVAAVAAVLAVGAALMLGGSDGGERQEIAADDASVALDASSTTLSPTTTAPTTTVAPTTTAPPDDLLPPSGSGRRVVFSIERQRMWWVDENETVLRTALVSGRANTPQQGTFQVYSKTLNATGLDGSRMDYFVRFTKGPNGWAIGFHDIPRMDGVPVQTPEQLGQPLSHGCIRQSTEDAQFTWEFLDVGSTVVVVA
jgi:hypothetical protein